MRDEEFLRTKVPMTKSEVRAISLDKLQLQGAKRLLDIGAGTGSVSLQATIEHPKLQVEAIEKNPDAIEIMRANMAKFQTTNLHLYEGVAPADLPDQQFDAIFVGGSGNQLETIVAYAADHLQSGGRLVLNFILFENALRAQQAMRSQPFMSVEMVEASIAKWHALGQGHFFKPNNPTMILSAIRKERS